MSETLRETMEKIASGDYGHTDSVVMAKGALLDNPWDDKLLAAFWDGDARALAELYDTLRAWSKQWTGKPPRFIDKDVERAFSTCEPVMHRIRMAITDAQPSRYRVCHHCKDPYHTNGYTCDGFKFCGIGCAIDYVEETDA